MRNMLILCAVLALAPSALATTPEQACFQGRPTGLKAMIGKYATKARIARASRSIEDPATKMPTRVIKPDMAVTMDYREDRLNIQIDRRTIIRKMTCG